MSKENRSIEDALAASGRLLKEFVAVSYELEQTEHSFQALREFLEHGGKDDQVGVRILACILHVHVLAQKLLAMEIAARG